MQSCAAGPDLLHFADAGRGMEPTVRGRRRLGVAQPLRAAEVSPVYLQRWKVDDDAAQRGRKGDYAETVLLPGDPQRAEWIAENFLSDARA